MKNTLINEERAGVLDKLISKLISWKYSVCEPRRVRRERLLAWTHPEHAVYVITPTYNRCELLYERAYKSLCNQTFTHWTWIVIGDNCTDGTAARMDEICKNDDRVFFSNMSKYKKRHPLDAETMWFCGPVYALNAALDLVYRDHRGYSILGEWIANIDDDDVWEPTHLEHAVKYALDHNLEFVSAWNDELREGVHKIIKDDPATHNIGARATWVYRSYLSFMKYNVNCFRKRWNKVNDCDMAERMLKAGVRVGMLPEVHAYTIPRPNETQIGLKAYKEAEEKHYNVHS